MQAIIGRVSGGEDLTQAEMAEAIDQIMQGKWTEPQLALFLTALHHKGETSSEIAGAAAAMRKHMTPIRSSHPLLLDTCGTGGDRLNTFNISTTAAFIAAAAGVSVAKHGNRAASSKCGSADVLEALGVPIILPAEAVGRLIDEAGIGFLFAAALHPAMKHAAVPRREIGVRTVFNLLGPLTNPAGAKHQVLGVFEEWGCELLAGALAKLGSEKAMVVHGRAGIDEMATFGETLVCEVTGEKVESWVFRPADAGLKEIAPEAIEGGEPARNAEVFLEVLSGGAPAAREISCLNAGAAIYVAGLAGSLQEGLAAADRAVSEGAAMDTFVRYRDMARAEGERS